MSDCEIKWTPAVELVVERLLKVGIARTRADAIELALDRILGPRRMDPSLFHTYRHRSDPKPRGGFYAEGGE